MTKLQSQVKSEVCRVLGKEGWATDSVKKDVMEKAMIQLERMEYRFVTQKHIEDAVWLQVNEYF